ncbi:MAG: 5-bromo-4-chloroindolyl phosphate hydrolysis family protein [Oscillospiraceae bacterium]|nr:5-bromo-4-chloroindolyl phosphate hydrolysis family protein [Oscillospiraceae bacterium]
MEKVKKVKHRNVIPIYAVGAVWVLCTFFLQFRGVVGCVRMTVFSLIAFYLCKSIFPDWEQTVPVEEPKAQTQPKSAEQTAMEQERDKALSEIRRLNERIQDPVISGKIYRIENATSHIYSSVMDQPEKKKDVRTFFNFYLPTTIKLLNQYERLNSMGASGENINSTKKRIEDMLESICVAFEKQLDLLYQDEAMDISTDITVLKQMMQQQGLN